VSNKFPTLQKLSFQTSIAIIGNSAANVLRFLFIPTADPPHITTHPKGLKDAVPGQPVTFTVHASGTEPISYQWQWKPPAGDDQGESEEWQLCDMEWFHNITLKIPDVQKLNEGSYQCVVSNCAGSQTSNTAKLSVGKNQLYEASQQHHSFIGLSTPIYIQLILPASLLIQKG